jgi:hypothetical protein
MACNGICHRFGNIGDYNAKHKSTQSYYKKCSVCEIAIDIEGYRCPCCHFLLRTRALGRSNEFKKRVLD